MRNIFKEFSDIFSAPPLQIGTVLATDGAVCTIELPGGGVLRARGDALVGQRVFVRDGLIEGPAPELDYIEGEV